MVFCQRLVAETGLAISPGSGFGPGGSGYVRFALVQPEQVLVACAGTLREFIAEHGDVIRQLSADKLNTTSSKVSKCGTDASSTVVVSDSNEVAEQKKLSGSGIVAAGHMKGSCSMAKKGTAYVIAHVSEGGHLDQGLYSQQFAIAGAYAAWHYDI
eukprot:jgi/Chrzof1/14818/Cz09g17140.t1